jgi:hypothetical protein
LELLQRVYPAAHEVMAHVPVEHAKAVDWASTGHAAQAPLHSRYPGAQSNWQAAWLLHVVVPWGSCGQGVHSAPHVAGDNALTQAPSHR